MSKNCVIGQNPSKSMAREPVQTFFKPTVLLLVMVHNPAHDLFSFGNFLCRVRVIYMYD